MIVAMDHEAAVEHVEATFSAVGFSIPMTFSPAECIAGALGLIAATVVAAAAYGMATHRDRYYLAFGATAVLMYTLVAALMYPFMDPATGLAVISTLPLNLMSVVVAVLLPLVFGYVVVLYSAFRGPVEAGEAY